MINYFRHSIPYGVTLHAFNAAVFVLRRIPAGENLFWEFMNIRILSRKII